MSDIDKLIEKNQKMGALLREYKESKAYESCLYDVRVVPGRPSWFMLFAIGISQEVHHGDAKNIRTWLERRSISEDKVYNYELIRKLPPVPGEPA